MVGRTISHYQILEKLGEGGMGVVWKAEDTKLKRPVALKFVPADAAGDAELCSRFRQEAQAAAGLSHPNVCTVYDIDEECGFLAMEFVEGETAQARVRRRPLPLAEALDIAMQAAQGLQAAHEHGVIHRDVKSANLMVTPQGTVKIMDFGLARLPGRMHMTKTGAVVGTPGYMSPEQALGKEVDRRTDLWSLGVVLYEMVTGQLPFRGESEAAVVHSILHDDPEPVTALRAGLPLELDRLVRKALEKDPAMRYQSAADMGADLRRLRRDSDPRARSAEVPAAVRTRPPRRLTRWAAGVAVALGAAVGIFLWQRTHAAPLTDKDVLVLADFTNTTGDPVFDGTLRQALAVQLEQSPFLKIISDEQMRQDLRLMGRPAGERITNQVAREICQRENEKAMIGGSIASLGKTYAITLQATNCQTGESLAGEQVEAEDKEHVLRAVAGAAKGMRAKLGESLASIQKLAVPSEQVTTTSLEAFQAYALGQEQRWLGLSVAAIPFYKRAIDLDPNFASAYTALGTVYANSRETGRGAGYLREAFALVDRVSERERLEISAQCYWRGTGEINKGIDAGQLYARTYPREAFPRNVLGNLYRATGDWEKALPEYQEAVRLDPRFAYPYSNQVPTFSYLDRFDEAKAVAARAFAQKVDSPAIHLYLLRIAYIQDDREEVKKHIQWLAGKAEEYLSLETQATDAAVLGQLRKGQELLLRAAELARRQNLPDNAARFRAQEAQAEAQMGDCEAARSKARAAILPEQAPADTLAASLPLALCGDAAAAQKAAEQTSKRYPVDTLWNAVHLPSIRAAIELGRNQPDRAVELLQSAAPYERAYPFAVYLRGLAYLRARKGAEAAIEFQKILDHKGANWGPYYPLSYVGLARAAVLSGDTARARTAYQDFLALWKDADPDLPILKEAQQEYAKLK